MALGQDVTGCGLFDVKQPLSLFCRSLVLCVFRTVYSKDDIRVTFKDGTESRA